MPPGSGGCVAGSGWPGTSRPTPLDFTPSIRAGVERSGKHRTGAPHRIVCVAIRVRALKCHVGTHVPGLGGKRRTGVPHGIARVAIRIRALKGHAGTVRQRALRHRNETTDQNCFCNAFHENLLTNNQTEHPAQSRQSSRRGMVDLASPFARSLQKPVERCANFLSALPATCIGRPARHRFLSHRALQMTSVTSAVTSCVLHLSQHARVATSNCSRATPHSPAHPAATGEAFK